MNDLHNIFEFLKRARGLYLVKRFTPHPNNGFENDAEHSWSVAFICMILASRLEKEFDVVIDKEKILKMALVHDVAEIRTGDTKTWDKEARMNKEEKERRAMHELVDILPSDLKNELLSLWEEVEARETLEAKIVKSIDRMDPMLHRCIFDIGWKEQVEKPHASIKALDERQLPRHSFSKTLEKLYMIVRGEVEEKNMLASQKKI